MSDADPNVYADATQVAGTREAIIELDGVSKSFGSFQALKDINLRVGQQEVVVVTDDCDVMSVPKFEGGKESAKTAADDDDACFRVCH